MDVVIGIVLGITINVLVIAFCIAGYRDIEKYKD
jgi:hypothetical protein